MKRKGFTLVYALLTCVLVGCSSTKNSESISSIEEKTVSENSIEEDKEEESIQQSKFEIAYPYDDYEYVIYNGQRVKLEDLLTGEERYFARADIAGDEEKEIAFLSGKKMYIIDKESRVVFYEGTDNEILLIGRIRGVYKYVKEENTGYTDNRIIAFNDKKESYVEKKWGWNGSYYFDREDNLDYETWNTKRWHYAFDESQSEVPWTKIESIKLILSDGKYSDSETEREPIEVGNSEFENVVNKVVNIPWDQRIEDVEWIEEGEVLRIAIERVEIDPREYRHLNDYIFVKKETIKYIEVTYPSKDDIKADRYVWDACDFDVKYEDVNFDNQKDILVFLGHAGNRGVMRYCAYVYEDDEFKYARSFEDIPYYKINNEEQCIEGWCLDGAAHYYDFKYKYIDGDFVEIERKYYEWDDDKQEFIILLED